MSWSKIRPQIVQLTATLSVLQEVAETPKIEFSGFPAAHVIPSDNTNDYETTAENERQYSFLIRVFAETKSQSIQKAYESLEEVVDQVIDLFDFENQKGGDTRIVGINLPNNYMFINIFAAPSKWLEFPAQNEIMAEITIKVRISVDIT